MERKTFQKCAVFVLTVMLFVFAASAVNSVFVTRMEKLASHFSVVDIDWEKLYPFKSHLQPQISNISTYAQITSYMTSRVANYSKQVFGKEKLIGLAVKAEQYLVLPNMSDYRILEDDYLVEYSRDKIDVKRPAESLENLNDFLHNLNIGLLYVQLPDKVCKEETTLLPHNMSNKNADGLLTALKQAGVPYLDMRHEIHEHGLVHHDLFFKTDTHWKPETGLWASKIIAEYLNSYFGFEIDTSFYDLKRYQYKVYDDFLGAIGKLATLAYANLEPISFLFPVFGTDLTVKIPSRNVDKRGDFRVTYNQEYLEYLGQKNVYEKDYYSVYSRGNLPVMSVRNNQESKKKILMIRDSFSCVVTPFLALGVKDIDVLDLRYFTGSVRSFIEESLPDTVLILYSPWLISNTEIKNAFDFR